FSLQARTLHFSCFLLLYFFLYAFFVYIFFFFNDPATTEIYTLSLHDALPICSHSARMSPQPWITPAANPSRSPRSCASRRNAVRSEEHTSELQSRGHLVCRLLLEKKKKSITAQKNLSLCIEQRYETLTAMKTL